MSDNSQLSNLFVNEQNREETTKEIVVQAPSETDLKAVAASFAELEALDVQFRPTGDGGAQELVVRGPSEMDLETLAGNLGELDRIDVETHDVDGEGTDAADTNAVTQQSLEQQARASRSFAEQLTDRMTFGRSQSPGAAAAMQQIKQDSQDPPADGGGSVYETPDIDSRELRRELDAFIDQMGGGTSGR